MSQNAVFAFLTPSDRHGETEKRVAGAEIYGEIRTELTASVEKSGWKITRTNVVCDE
jgi:hypothetical protein